MKVRLTALARADLDSIAEYVANNYPAIGPRVEMRIRAVIAHVAEWPEAAPRVSQRTDVRVIPVGRYPYRIYYRLADEVVEILRIRHVAQRPIIR